jgi:cytochrome oxidase assembly protein ShyY1
VLRTALKPQWLALLALALALATVFAALGSWQLERSRREDPTAVRPLVELTDVAEPQTAFPPEAARADVRARGTYRADEQLLVVDRPLDGQPGAWVLTPLTVRVDDGSATLPVVRGWVPEGTKAPEPPSGEVTVVGRLQGSEAPGGLAGDGRVNTVSAAELLNQWGGPVYAGYLAVTEVEDGGPLRAVPVQGSEDGGFRLLNFSYALQWWVFAVFAVLLWWRMLRDSYLRENARTPAEEHSSD